MENSTIFFILLVVFGTIWFVIKTPSKVKEEVKEDNINRNIQTINKMGYLPEEDDELDGFEQVERPAVNLKPGEEFKERYERLKKAGYYVNDHVKSVID
ncbi:MAG: hypothetical protein WA079_01465 [Leuconostoc falkenbergense]|uniref:hypothetical protein n=1 Tax=Leuconostoc falkenbergense TaxID=2766470 RepID=UPI003BB60793